MGRTPLQERESPRRRSAQHIACTTTKAQKCVTGHPEAKVREKIPTAQQSTAEQSATLLKHIPGAAGHDVVDVWPLEAVEGGRGGDRVGAHVLKDQPVAHLQLGQVALLHDAVEAVARWTPNTAGVHFLIWLWLLLASESTTTLECFLKQETAREITPG